MMLQFVAERSVGQVAEELLTGACARRTAEGKRAQPLIWDCAAWHAGGLVGSRIEAHNQLAKAEGSVRGLACYLPLKPPWLNAIKPK